ncbi:hypothetical protein LTR15_011446 [Elasticomyces elasticus]|nr:hypothetical protein LTR15_011446 [Elasticomyces elasticus]
MASEAFSPSPSPSPPPADYREANALIIYSTDDTKFLENAEFLRSALVGLNYGVKTRSLAKLDDEQDWYNEFGRWASREDAKPPNRLVLVYFGHGGVLEKGLTACDGGEDFSLTPVQRGLRDVCEADVLFVLGTCHSGHRIGEARDSERPDHIVETLACCDGMTETNCDDWVRRLTGLLDHIRKTNSKMTVREAAKLISRLRTYYGKGFYSQDSGRESMMFEVLPERMMQCGGGEEPDDEELRMVLTDFPWHLPR